MSLLITCRLCLSRRYLCYNIFMNTDPLHNKTLQIILEELVKKYSWKGLREKINIRCFWNEPSISSSLKFLRRTPWARKEVEELYIKTFKK
jgi:uncharacterized protein (DUF2132 family)